MIIDDINAKVSMLDILKMYNIEPVRYNSYKCPFHQDKHPSAGITKNGKFHCFSCGWTGDQIDFVMEYEKCDKKTAIKLIDHKFKLGLCKALTPTEKRALEKARFLRAVEQYHKEKENAYAQKIIDAVYDQIKFWERVKQDCEPRFTEFLTGNWELSRYYFIALKNCDRLNYIYEVLYELDITKSLYEYIYPSTKEAMIEAIKSGEIDII